MKKVSIFLILIASILLVGTSQDKIQQIKSTNTPRSTRTIKVTTTPIPTRTLVVTRTLTITTTPSKTSTPTITFTPSATFPVTVPYPDAPLCETHDPEAFHTLWDIKGCHYDHEHGVTPFTSSVANLFPDFDLRVLLGNREVGHTNPSSEMEFTHKHGGLKWNVQTIHPQRCEGFEGAMTGVNGSAIQYHGFGDYAIEAEARLHSTVALLRQCRSTNPTDYGYVFINQLQDYGQRISPYQGTILPYPNQPVPSFPSPRGPYLSFDCLGNVIQCRASLDIARRNNSNTVWTSKVTGTGHSDTPSLFRLLWRAKDIYNLVKYPFDSYPLNFVWICGGETYNPDGCRYNNTTTQVHEIQGFIPYAWDNLREWDTNMTVGRVTAEGWVNEDGNINPTCSESGADCYPIKLINAFTGVYGSVLVFTDGKGTNVVPIHPERDIHFCNGVLCSDSSAIPSGWVGTGN